MFVILQSPLKTEREVVINEGQGVYEIADSLIAEGVIDNKFAFVVFVVISGNEKKLKAGRYVFRPGATIPAIVRSMSEEFSESDDIVVTIPEGFNVFDVDKRLFGLGLLKEGEFAGKYYADEGQFFPDTYRFKKEGETADTIAQKMKNHLNLKFKDTSIVLSVLVFRDTLIRASILEKEARKEEDMRLVAGVIENRLERGMLLQIDATVAYGACLRKLESLKIPEFNYCDVSQAPIRAEIKIDGPYNTYTSFGLPSGPIANPGITAIRAVLNPIKSDYLYYLSTRDGGKMIFSKTSAEHAANRRKYLGI
ncbi:MAG: endolytic transglycosylase MltG [Patescibacteria group bacterium]